MSASERPSPLAGLSERLARVGGRVGWRSVITVLLAPLLFAGGFVFATWQADDRLQRVQAAVVNLDEPVTLDGQTVPLGRQLTAGLVEGDADRPELNLSWVLSDAEDATDGLASGRYAAVITIPKDFSAAATSFSDAESAEQATITVQTSEITAIADGAITDAISRTAVQVFNTELTKTYLDNIYLGFNTISEQFGTAAGAAEDLADGADGVATGARQSANGAGELAEGLTQLSTGAQQLSQGSPQLRTGGAELKTGTAELATQTRQLPAQTRQLATGTAQLSTGVNKLATGAATYATGVKTYTDGVGQAATGVQQLKTGASQLATGAKQNAAGVKTYTDGVGQAATGARQLSTGATQLSTGARQNAAGVAQYREFVAGLSEGQFPGGCPAEVPAVACPSFLAGVSAAGQAALVGLDGDGTQANPGLVAGAQGLSTGATQLAGGVGQTADGLEQLDEGGEQLATGATQLSTGASGVSTGVTATANGLQKLDEGGEQLATGATQLSSGVAQLKTGAAQLATGTQQFADATPQLSNGIQQLATGVGQYVDGVSAYSTGVDQIASGVQQTSTGSTKLASGLTQLADGTDKLSDGTQQFADGLRSGAGQVPTYDQVDRDRLTEVVTAPVTVADGQPSLPQLAATSLLVATALFLGALISYLIMRPLPSDVLLSTRPAWLSALQATAPAAVIAAVQAVVLGVIGRIVLDLDVAHTAALVGLGLLGGLGFVLVNQALAIWGGDLGRLVAMIMVVLAAAGQVISAVPELFDTVRPFLPLTPVIDGIRAMVTDAPVTDHVIAMIGWLVLGAVATLLGAARHRLVSASGLGRLATV